MNSEPHSVQTLLLALRQNRIWNYLKGKFGINWKKFRTNGANVEANSKLWVCIIGSVSVFLPL